MLKVILKLIDSMLPKLLNNEYFATHNKGIKLFCNWYMENNKAETGINLNAFFNLHFEVQIGFYLDWLFSNNVMIAFNKEYMWLDDRKGLDSLLARGDLYKRVVIKFNSNLTVMEQKEQLLYLLFEALECPF